MAHTEVQSAGTRLTLSMMKKQAWLQGCWAARWGRAGTPSLHQGGELDYATL